MTLIVESVCVHMHALWHVCGSQSTTCKHLYLLNHSTVPELYYIMISKVVGRCA